MHMSAVMARGRLPMHTITSSIHRAAWLDAALIPRGANHIGVAAKDGVIYAFGGFVEQNRIATLIHAVGGRDKRSNDWDGAHDPHTFDFNTGMYNGDDQKANQWEERAPTHTPRSGHGGPVWRGKFFCMSSEGTRRVFGQIEAYDLRSD
jgi:hypothetical protein